MPRPEQVVARADPNQGYGAQAQIQRLASQAPVKPQAPPTSEPQAAGGVSVPSDIQPTGDVSGGYDDELFAPTDRPNEPITHGAPFGAGASFIPQPGESDRDFMLRVANQLQAAPSTPRVQQYIAAIQRGQ